MATTSSQLLLAAAFLATLALLSTTPISGRPSDHEPSAAATPSTLLPAEADAVFPYRHVHLTNQLESNNSMIVHCKSKEDDLGIHYIGDGSEYTWRFKPRLVFGRTQFWCYVAPVSVALHIQFDAYIFNDPSIIEYKYNVYWLVKPDGVYIRDPYDGKEEFRYRWAPGRIVV